VVAGISDGAVVVRRDPVHLIYAGAFEHTCPWHGVPAYDERSRSGNGAHVRVLFLEQISARLSRCIGSLLLTETMERRSRKASADPIVTLGGDEERQTVFRAEARRARKRKRAD
jgi:hypothetical protein